MTAEELVVVAALLGHDALFGVESDPFIRAGADLRERIRRCVHRLERRRLLRYDLDGVLYIDPDLRGAVDRLATAERVALFTTDRRAGKRESVTVAVRDGAAAVLEGGGGEYTLRLTDGTVPDGLLSLLPVGAPARPMREMMLLEEAALIHEMAANFDMDGAVARAATHLTDPAAAEPIARILAGGCGYLSARIHQRQGGLYRAVYHALTVTADGSAVAVTVDDQDMVRFTSVDADGASACLGARFLLSTEGDAV